MSLNNRQKDIAGLLAEWREVTDNPEVTAAPWSMEEDWAYIASGSDSVIHGYYEGDCPACGDEIQDDASVALSGENAAFIATSRTAMPALLTAVENVQRAVGIEALAKEWMAHCGYSWGDVIDAEDWRPDPHSEDDYDTQRPEHVRQLEIACEIAREIVQPAVEKAIRDALGGAA